MTKVLWIVLGLVCAILSVVLYKTIDSDWASENNVGILITLAFFATATTTIVCCFNLIESQDQSLKQ